MSRYSKDRRRQRGKVKGLTPWEPGTYFKDWSSFPEKVKAYIRKSLLKGLEKKGYYSIRKLVSQISIMRFIMEEWDCSRGSAFTKLKLLVEEDPELEYVKFSKEEVQARFKRWNLIANAPTVYVKYKGELDPSELSPFIEPKRRRGIL